MYLPNSMEIRKKHKPLTQYSGAHNDNLRFDNQTIQLILFYFPCDIFHRKKENISTVFPRSRLCFRLRMLFSLAASKIWERVHIQQPITSLAYKAGKLLSSNMMQKKYPAILRIR